ncbi:MAG: MerR family transcriptional regulator [Sphingorhabdus sp.]
MLDKEPEAFLTIGEMADRLGVKTHILRYWEEQFPMLTPLKRAGGRRLYRSADVALLERIQDLLDRQGYTIRGARDYLAKAGEATEPPAAAASAPTAQSATDPQNDRAIYKELQAIRNRLSEALAAA